MCGLSVVTWLSIIDCSYEPEVLYPFYYMASKFPWIPEPVLPVVTVSNLRLCDTDCILFESFEKIVCYLSVSHKFCRR